MQPVDRGIEYLVVVHSRLAAHAAAVRLGAVAMFLPGIFCPAITPEKTVGFAAI
jgi:hypothetical protein